MEWKIRYFLLVLIGGIWFNTADSIPLGNIQYSFLNYRSAHSSINEQVHNFYCLLGSGFSSGQPIVADENKEESLENFLQQVTTDCR